MDDASRDVHGAEPAADQRQPPGHHGPSVPPAACGQYPALDTGSETKALLSEFLPPGKSLDNLTAPIASLDEYGRAFTAASRKTARARATMVIGTGLIYLNGVSYDQNTTLQERVKITQPFLETQSFAKYNVWLNTAGGGQMAQAEAIAVAIARGLSVHDAGYKKILDALKMTKIDRRQVEPKKTGQPKARKKIQWVKR